MTATRVRGKQSDRKRQRSPRPRQCRADAEVKTKEVACSKRKRRWTVNDVHNSVLKVFVWHVQPNYKQPWCSEAQTSSTSSAWPIRLNGALRVVTNAHSVEHAALVQVKRHRHEQKYVAQVLCIGTDCDLALLEVPHADFWKGLEPLEILPGLPKLQDSVSVVGYPTGGESLSVTQGVVSRIDLVEPLRRTRTRQEVKRYAQTGVTLLAVQIDAAINSGNSGGPVVDQKGNCVGVAFQNLDGDEESAENIGYIIPTEIVQHFLEDFLKNGHFTGFGSAGIHTQALESPVLREALGMAKNQSGIRVKAVETAGPANGIILPDDVLLAVDGFKGVRLPASVFIIIIIQIGNDGEVAMPWGRVAFNYLLNRHYPGEHCEMQVLRREGSPKKITLQVCLERNRDLVCADAGGPDATAGSMLPRFLVTGGLVFVPLTMPFMEAAFGENFAEKRPAEMPAELLHLLENGHRRCADHEPLILTQVLASELTVGYSELEYEVLESFNGIQVRNLRHLAELLDGSKDTYLRFGFVSKEIVVLDRLKATQALASILAQNMIPAARSQL
ncbi:unnamed protein product [Durusdinium trenchii]|uniref:Protease Do-like PDZ domain-containing protein n=1 Tax=Durusdinium trenchii TaxID=1381693 RepID=A0ABP0QTJ3_9DINO